MCSLAPERHEIPAEVLVRFRSTEEYPHSTTRITAGRRGTRGGLCAITERAEATRSMVDLVEDDCARTVSSDDAPSRSSVGGSTVGR